MSMSESENLAVSGLVGERRDERRDFDPRISRIGAN
jgi:hypothetical protein